MDLEHSTKLFSETKAFSALPESLSQLAMQTRAHRDGWNALFRSHGSHKQKSKPVRLSWKVLGVIY